MISEKNRKAIESLENGRYKNNAQISLGRVPFTAREVIIAAPLIASLNAYYVGGTGEGKTQLGHDLLSIANGRGCYAMGRPDFEPSELLKQIRLDNLRKAKTDRDLVELTSNVRKNVYLVDELNRCPPIVQNYFFDFFDGKIVTDGKIMKLGDRKYSVGFATGNLGDGEYVGVSESDRALLDRLHLILKLDHPDYRPTNTNMLEVFMGGKKNPRTDVPEGSNFDFNNILELNNEFNKRDIELLFPALGVYLTRGLDYLENVKGHSKKAVDTRWPNLEGIKTDNDENKLFPLSPRAVFSAIGFSSALEMIAESKGLDNFDTVRNKDATKNRVNLFLDSLRLTVPYSGVIAHPYIEQEHNGNVYSAFDELLGPNSTNRREILQKVESLETALGLAYAGEQDLASLKDIAPTDGRWTAVANSIKGLAEKKAKNPDPDATTAKDIIDKVKQGSA